MPWSATEHERFCGEQDWKMAYHAAGDKTRVLDCRIQNTGHLLAAAQDAGKVLADVCPQFGVLICSVMVELSCNKQQPFESLDGPPMRWGAPSTAASPEAGEVEFRSPLWHKQYAANCMFVGDANTYPTACKAKNTLTRRIIWRLYRWRMHGTAHQLKIKKNFKRNMATPRHVCLNIN